MGGIFKLDEKKEKPGDINPCKERSLEEESKWLDEQIVLSKKRLELARVEKELQEVKVKSIESDKKDMGAAGKVANFIRNIPDPPPGGLMNQSVFDRKTTKKKVR